MDCNQAPQCGCVYSSDCILEELEGKCHALWLLRGGETDKWNGESCMCPWSQGNLVCERMKYIPGI